MRNYQEVVAAYSQSAPTNAAALTALGDLSIIHGRESEYFLSYARGYFKWLMAGKPSLTAAQIQAIGSSAPNPQDAFTHYLNGVFDIARILK